MAPVPQLELLALVRPLPLDDLGVAVGVLEDDRAVLQGFEAVHGGFVLDEVREAVGLSRELVVLLHDGDALQRSIRGERRPELLLRGGPREPGLAFRILSLSNSKFPEFDFEFPISNLSWKLAGAWWRFQIPNFPESRTNAHQH